MLVVLNPYYAMAALYLSLGALAVLAMVLSNLGIIPAVSGLLWLRVHTIVLGGISQIVFGTLPGMVAARVGAPAPDRNTHWRLWGVLNLSILLVMLGMVAGSTAVFTAGAVVALAADAYLFIILWRLGNQGDPGRRTTARMYAVATFYLFLGILMALTMITGWPPAPGGPAGAREAHIHANAWGFLNLVIALSLYDRVPELLGRPLAFSRLVKRLPLALAIGGFLLILGPWAGRFWITALGLVPYLTAVVVMWVSILVSVARARPANPAAGWHLAAAYFWLALPAVLAPFVLILGEPALPVGRIELVAVQSLISGWALQVAMALLPGVIHRRQAGTAPVPCAGKSHRVAMWVALVLANVGPALFWLAGLGVPSEWYGPVLGVGYGLVFLAWLPFLARTWRSLALSARAAD